MDSDVATDAGPLADRAAAALRDALGGRRWFAGKNRSVAEVTPVDEAAMPGTPGVLALFDVLFADQGRERYCIPVTPPAAGQEPFVDAMADPVFCLALLEAIRAGATLAGQRGAFRCTATAALTEIVPTAPRECRPVGSEQSNTSVVYDRRAILKLLRRLESGPSAELELSDFLTRQAAFPGAPRLGGAVTYEADGAEPITLAVLHEFVPNQGDAWTATLERLGEYYAAAIEGRGEESPDPVFARALASADAHEAARLGVLTGRLHRALASAPPDHPLAAQPIQAQDVDAWTEDMLAQHHRATEALAAGLPALPPSLRGVAQRVVGEGARLAEGLRGLTLARDQRCRRRFASTATTTSGSSSERPTASRSSTSRASPRGPWRSGAPSSACSRTWPGCSGRSPTPRRSAWAGGSRRAPTTRGSPSVSGRGRKRGRTARGPPSSRRTSRRSPGPAGRR